jgi:hypothetical protein
MQRIIHLSGLPNLKEATEIKFIIPANAGSQLNVEFVFPEDLIAEQMLVPVQGQINPIVSNQTAASIMATPSPGLKSPPKPMVKGPFQSDNPLSSAKAEKQASVVIPTPQSLKPGQKLTMNSPPETLKELSGEQLSQVFIDSQSGGMMPGYMAPYRCTPAVDLDGNATCVLQGRSSMK